ncbi:hypothetical protein [Elizabethkingia meningoseptica]|uniref:hypothetical protein n=1 Tax=Elizabethkingia meningoseptica TaxID=238 RepID=UPI0031584605
MEAKEKAEELVNKMHKSNWKMTHYSAVSCAIICVEEILDLCKKEFDTSIYSPADYWKEVKTELEKME